MKKTVLALLCLLCLVPAVPHADDLAAIYGRNVISESFDPEIYKPDTEQPWTLSKYWDKGWADYIAYDKATHDVLHTIWSSDGKWIAFTCGGDTRSIFIVPAGGGDPILIRHSYQEYEGYMLPTGIFYLHCFTPDSKEILFTEALIDESKGTTVTIEDTESSFGYSINGSIPTMKAVDIETSEERILDYKASDARFSPDGSYFAYKFTDLVDNKLIIYHVIENTVTKQTHTIEEQLSCYRFTPDGNFIIYLAKADKKLWKVPVAGGDPEEVTVNGEGSGSINYFDIHPGGEWIVYVGGDGPRSTDSYSSSDFRTLFAYNTVSGESRRLTPQGTLMEAMFPSFSPDGGKVCYIARDYSIEDKMINVRVLDVDLPNVNRIFVENVTPDAFSLSIPYPNPFNPSTTIEFTLPSAGFTELSIFNTAGQRIRQLVSGDLAPGSHSVVWDGRNNSGESVSSGVYISRLETGNMRMARRMTLAK